MVGKATAPSTSTEVDRTVSEEGAGNVDAVEDFFTVVGVWERSASRSRATRTETIEVRFHNWERAFQPERLLSRCIQRLMERVLQARAEPLRVGLSVQPPGWDNCFHVPMRTPQQNTPDAMAAAIEAFAKQYDELDLFSADVRFKVSAVWTLPASTVGGACAEDEQHARGTVRCQSYVPIVNGGDRWCLARAIVIGLADRRICVLEGRNVDHFRAFCGAQQGLAGAQEARLLLQAAAVPLGLQTYGVAEAQRIQQWLNASIGAQQVRLVIFARELAFRVAWKGEQPARFNLCLVAQNGHYGYIQRPEQLLHARQYCVDCEQPVDRRTHPQGCRALCPQCLRYGWGRPCARVPEDPRGPLLCNDCLFVFDNEDCFEAHRRRVDPPPPGWQHDGRRGRPHRPMCEERRVCVRCRQIMWARQGVHHCAVNNNNNIAQRICDQCYAEHDPQWTPHFIQPKLALCQLQRVAAAAAAGRDNDVDARVFASDSEGDDDVDDDDDAMLVEEGAQPARPPRRKPIRFMFWDVECAQRTLAHNVDGEDEEEAAQLRKHIPVLVCAELICERCIVSGVDLEQHPQRRAPDCCCGGAGWRGGRRRQWLMRQGEDVFSDAENDNGVVDAAAAEASNPRRLRFFHDAVAGRTPMEQFVDFLQHDGPVNVRTVMLAHNGGRYDVHLMLEELQRRGVRPRRLIATGLRVYTLELGGRNQRSIVVKDTLNFFGCALAKLPAMFGLEGVPDKPFFPYNYICEANMDVQHVGLPPADTYDPDRMRPVERASFERWYAAEQERRPHRVFVLRRELLRYCANDVRILRLACLRFRQVVAALSGGVEPFLAASTIAGLAMSIYRHCHLPRDLMVHTPEGGFLRGRRASAASRHFFALLERLRPEWRGRMRTAQWSIGEACVEDDGYRLDALVYRPVPLRPLAIEFNGCYFHGCSKCYPRRQQFLAGGQTAEALLARTRQRAWELEQQHGYALCSVWECEFQQWLRRRPVEVRHLYADVCRAHPGPLDLRRDALFGGRVEPLALHYVASDEEDIDVLDIVSLYPFVMKYRPFPVCLPRVLTGEQLVQERLPWTRPEQVNYRGFLQCRVLPPTPAELGERHTLLPYRTRNGRLTFPLCATCAEAGNAEKRQQMHRTLPRCRHREAKRAWTLAYTDVELKAALQLGYRVLAVYEVWHYEQWASLEAGNSLFADYVNTLLRLKVEASGWPADCQTEEQREQYIAGYARQEGIRIDAQRVEHNPGLRAVAKALLNSLWGKLAQRAERDDIRYTDSAREFHELLGDPRQDVVDFVHLNEQLDRCVVRRRWPFVRAPETNNLAVACFVTAYARIYLHERLEEVRLSGGRMLYCDTDSVYFVKRRGALPLRSEGDAFGQLKRELPGRRIVQFFCAGPKNYGFRHVCALTGGDERAERKVRGLELTYVASQLLPFNRMCNLVLNTLGRLRNAERRVAVPVRNFVRTKRAEIFTRASTKLYQPVYTKGLVVAVNHVPSGGTAYFTRPFGWHDDAEEDNADADDEIVDVNDDDDGDESDADIVDDILHFN